MADRDPNAPPELPRRVPAATSAVPIEGATATPEPKLGEAKMSPPLTGLEVRLTPTAAAGVDLAKIVLNILSWAIFVFIVGLGLIELRDGSNAGDVDDRILRQAALETDFLDPGSIGEIVDLLETGAASTEATASASELEKSAAVRDSLSRYRVLSEDQRKSLDRCFPFPSSAERAALLKGCADVLRLAGKAAKAQAVNLEKLRALIDFSKDVDGRRQSFRIFWVQAAQLVLLNLLLPLLTGLFGYIFGTRQGSNNKDG